MYILHAYQKAIYVLILCTLNATPLIKLHPLRLRIVPKQQARLSHLHKCTIFKTEIHQNDCESFYVGNAIK